MEIVSMIINAVGAFPTGILNLILPFKVSIEPVECRLDKPRVSDGEGGFSQGSYVYFRLIITNRKNKKFLLENIYCIAKQKDKLLQDKISCHNRNEYKKIAAQKQYSDIKTLVVQPRSSVQYDVAFYSNVDLSCCDKLEFCYFDGLHNKQVTIWEAK